ncbi:LPXTG cell wall anchor domain-containing protein, partial [Salmonella enterica subsp. enterica serovar Newport]|nr:LPXTG cell wall anchor domain-containing protein [Salmonella enterica subsp. enterica serovar Newport]
SKITTDHTNQNDNALAKSVELPNTDVDNTEDINFAGILILMITISFAIIRYKKS